MEIADLRHLDEVKGNFGIVDGLHYRSTSKAGNSSAPPLLLSNSISAFVQQQQYFFDTLWKKSIPALQRIKEIEENLKRDFTETIRDSNERASLISKILSSSTLEIQLIFPDIESLKRFKELGMLDIIKVKVKNGILVQILIGANSPIKIQDSDMLIGFSQIEVNYLSKSIQTRNITIIKDRELGNIFPFDRGNYSNRVSKDCIISQVISPY